LTTATAIPAVASALANRDFQTAGRFDNHKVSGLKSPKQLTDAALVVGNGKTLSTWLDKDIQPRLGHVDSHKPSAFLHHRTSSRCLPSLAIRDFLPLQPFGLERREGAATFAARRGLGPKAAPACRAKSVDASTTSVTYKAVDKGLNLSAGLFVLLSNRVGGGSSGCGVKSGGSGRCWW
jgi:hypothetical protein